jgi:Spy/CpxP family protein refolding chaperone
MKWSVVLGSLALLGAAAVTVAAEPAREGHREGGPWGQANRPNPGMMAGQIEHWLANNPEAVKEVGLTTHQVAQLRADLMATRTQFIDLRAKMEKQAINQAALLQADHLDEAAVMKAVDETSRVRAEIAKLEMRQFLSLRKILTAEQWAKVRDKGKERWQDRRAGRGPGGSPPPEGKGHEGQHEAPPPPKAPDAPAE